MNKLITFLEKPKNRSLFLLPQTIVWIITMVNLYLHNLCGVYLLPYVGIINIISAILIVVSASVMLITDNKRIENKYKI